MSSSNAVQIESAVAFLTEAATYFERRPTGGEDMAFWANVVNKKNCEGIASILHQQEERIAELTRERDEAKREARSKDISYRTWKEFYGALLVAPPTDATPLEVRVHRQANVISDMQYRIRNLRKEIRRLLKDDPLEGPKWLANYRVGLHVNKLHRLWRDEADALSASQARVKVLEEALELFADAVFNDNGDMTVNLSTASSDDFIAAYFARRRNALKSEGEI